jgi:hypothetical protein
MKRSENKRCSECGEVRSSLNNLGQCDECARICEVCGISSHRTEINEDKLCSKCAKEMM